jgi:hypothetical protein
MTRRRWTNCRHGVPLDEACWDCTRAEREKKPEDLPLFADGTDTRRLAHEQVKPHLSRIMTEVYNVILEAQSNGMTTDEVIAALGRDVDWKNTLAPCVTKLKQLGMIVDSQRRRPSNRGNAMAVLIAKKKGGKAQR